MTVAALTVDMLEDGTWAVFHYVADKYARFGRRKVILVYAGSQRLAEALARRGRSW